MFFKKERIRDEKYKSYIRSLPCSVPGCPYASDAAHIRSGLEGGTGLKPSDDLINPICRIHHTEQGTWPAGEEHWWMDKVIKARSRRRYQTWLTSSRK
jgi:hypothetical protein